MLNFLSSVEDLINNRILGLIVGPMQRLVPNIPLWLQRGAIIVGVLLFSLALPFFVPTQRLILLPGLLMVLAALLVFVRWPPLGLIALIITCLSVPSPSLPGGFNVAVLLLMLLIGLWLVDMIVIKREIRLVSSRAMGSLLALVAIAIFAFGIGQLPWFVFGHQAPLDAQVGGLLIFVLAAGAFLLVAHQVYDLHWLQWLTWVFLGLSGLSIAGWLVPGLSIITNRMFQIGAVSNSMYWTWLVALAFSQAYLNDKLPWRGRITLGVLALATLYVAFFLNRDWKSGYLPPLASVAVIIGLRNWRAGVVMAIIAPLGAFYLSQDAIATDQYSYSTRVDAWLIVLEMVKVSPILGFGPANYYWYTPLFPIRGYAVQFNSHSQIIDLIAQTGVLGLVCFMWFFGEMVRLGWWLRNRASTGFAQAYVYGVIGGVAGTLVASTLADWVLPFVYNIGLNGFRGAIPAWLFLGGLVSLEQIIRRQTNNDPSKDN